MTKTSRFYIANRLTGERRNITLYQHSSGRAFLIGHGSSVSVEIHHGRLDDYLHLSVSKGPGALQRGCRVTLPAWLDFRFQSGQSTPGVSFTHVENGVCIDVPPGPPNWEVKISLPGNIPVKSLPGRAIPPQHITITSYTEV